MSDVPTLPAVPVYGTPDDGSPSSPVNFPGGGVPPGGGLPSGGFPGDWVARHHVANGAEVFRAGNAGKSVETAEAFFKGLSGQSRTYVEQQLNDMQYYGVWACNNLGAQQKLYLANDEAFILSLEYASYLNASGKATTAPSPEQPASSYDFYGTVLMPFAAMYYWIRGGGKTRRVNIASLNLQMVASDFRPLMDVINDRANGDGAYVINGHFEYNTFSRYTINVPAAGALGRINGEIAGTLIMQGDSWNFDGEYIINPDDYNADASNRPWPQEDLTAFLRGIGDAFGYQNYKIEVDGSMPVHFSGIR